MSGFLRPRQGQTCRKAGTQSQRVSENHPRRPGRRMGVSAHQKHIQACKGYDRSSGASSSGRGHQTNGRQSFPDRRLPAAFLSESAKSAPLPRYFAHFNYGPLPDARTTRWEREAWFSPASPRAFNRSSPGEGIQDHDMLLTSTAKGQESTWILRPISRGIG